MIPRRLIFIWFGKEIPVYGRSSIEAFSTLNPDCEIKLVHIEDPWNTQDDDLNDMMKIVYSGHKSIYRYLMKRDWIKRNLTSRTGKMTTISDAFRFYLLNKYGGIYLDLDTFPVRKFDDSVFEHDNGFCVKYHEGRKDIFFIGMPPGCVDNGLIARGNGGGCQVFSPEVFQMIYPDNIIRKLCVSYDDQYIGFVNGLRKIGRSLICPECCSTYYIDHFHMRTWRKK